MGHGKKRLRICIPGRRVYEDIITTPRNAHFEPHLNAAESVEACMARIRSCFENKLPCVISSHRLNYVSRLSQQNADSALARLNELLTRINASFPDVEFMNSLELGALINSRYS